MVTPEDIRIINAGTVDSRVKGSAGSPVKQHSQYLLEKVYCVFCGKPKGWVSQDSYKYIKAQNIIAVCDDCFEQYGTLPLPEAKEVKDIKI